MMHVLRTQGRSRFLASLEIGAASTAARRQGEILPYIYAAGVAMMQKNAPLRV